MRNPSFQGVQILATPKGNRRKDLAVDKRPIVGLDLEQSHELDVIPPSSIPRIPLSTARFPSTQESEKALLCEATPARPGTKVSPAIFRTPSSGQMKLSPCISNNFLGGGLQDRHGLPQSPLQARQSGRRQYLDIPISFAQAVECTPSKPVTVHATPVKQGKLNFIAHSNPPDIVVEGAGADEIRDVDVPRGKEDDSIYKSLGWDDYDELT